MRPIHEIALVPLELGLSFLERVLLRLVQPDDQAPTPAVFIIGPPRSGTTLLYQVLLNRYCFAYFTNLTARFYAAPTVGFWLARLLSSDKRPVRPGRYRSEYGRTGGWHGPHEAGRFWYRWFPKGEHVYVPPGATPESSLGELRREVAGMVKIARSPALFKNTYNSMRIAPIVEALPQACFLVCQRNPIDTAQSILRVRTERLDNKEQWWSLPPKEIDEIKEHPYWEQVVEQVYYTYKQIDEDRNRFDLARFYDVPYRKLCDNTHGTLASIETFLSSRGLRLKVRGDVPAHFPVSAGPWRDDRDYQLIVRKARQLWE